MEFIFKFNEEETNLILEALGDLPAKRSMGLINNIHTQAAESVKTKQREELAKQEALKQAEEAKKVKDLKKDKK